MSMATPEICPNFSPVSLAGQFGTGNRSDSASFLPFLPSPGRYGHKVRFLSLCPERTMREV